MNDRKCFSDQMNRNRFDPILARRDWSCSTMENLRCLNLDKLIKQSRAVCICHVIFVSKIYKKYHYYSKMKR